MSANASLAQEVVRNAVATTAVVACQDTTCKTITVSRALLAAATVEVLAVVHSVLLDISTIQPLAPAKVAQPSAVLEPVRRVDAPDVKMGIIL